MKSVNYNKIKETSDSQGIVIDEVNLNSFFSKGGGLIEKSAIFLTGTSGAGKTTFATFLQKLILSHKTSFYSREMSSESLKKMIGRNNIDHNNAFIVDGEKCKNLDEYIKEIDVLLPKVVIIDSLQVILKEDYSSCPYEQAIFEVIQKLRKWVEKNNAVLIMVGHVTKTGDFEGRNTIPHMFDAHLEMNFDKKKNERTISWAKNRFGEVGKVLYYRFGENSIDFFTKEEYDSLYSEKKQIEDYIEEAILKTLNSLDKKDPQYEAFKKELYSRLSILEKETKLLNTSDFDISIRVICEIKRVLNKYNL